MINPVKAKKIYRIIKRKWLKPFAYASIMSMLMYIIIGDIIIRQYSLSNTSPHFVITRIDDTFDETEYMHLLLTIQELNKTLLKHDLKKFVNEKFPAQCPKYLKQYLYKMNWEHKAFQIRVHKLFKMYETYDQIARLETTIEMLDKESETSNLSAIIYQQIHALKNEKKRITQNSLTDEEYQFIKEYGGVVPSLQILEEK